LLAMKKNHFLVIKGAKNGRVFLSAVVPEVTINQNLLFWKVK